MIYTDNIIMFVQSGEYSTTKCLSSMANIIPIKQTCNHPWKESQAKMAGWKWPPHAVSHILIQPNRTQWPLHIFYSLGSNTNTHSYIRVFSRELLLHYFGRSLPKSGKWSSWAFPHFAAGQSHQPLIKPVVW